MFAGFSVVKLIILGVVALLVISAVTGVLLSINSALKHHYVDPEKAIWDRSEAIYKANAQTLTDANSRLTLEFSDLTKEVNDKTAAFQAAADLAKKDFDTAIVAAQAKARASQPKIDELRRQAKEVTPVLEIQAKVHKMLVEYADDVQKVRTILGLQ